MSRNYLLGEVNKDRTEFKIETIWYSQHAGQGSGNTAIPHFTNQQEDNSGDMVTIDNNTTNGFTITVNRDCFIDASLSANLTTGKDAGWSLDSAALSTSITTIAQSERLQIDGTVTAGGNSSATINRKFFAGEVLRPHTALTPVNAAALWAIHIVVRSL